MRVADSILDLIGNTPLLSIPNFCASFCPGVKVLVKLESYNPGGSAKDRVAASMLSAAQRDGKLNTHTMVIEPTSGNTGIGLAAICAALGIRLTITMPDSMSKERIDLMRAYGAQVVLTPGAEGMQGAIKKAEELHAEWPDSILAGQFVNPANPRAHYHTTGPEIWRDTDGTVDYFVAGVGTGGTISGTGRFLKEKNPAVQIIGVEPAESAILTGGTAGAHGIMGIGAGFVPDTLDVKTIDKVFPIPTEVARDFAKKLTRSEGVLCGISGGAALAGVVALAEEVDLRGKTVVVLLPDSGERYLSVLYND